MNDFIELFNILKDYLVLELMKCLRGVKTRKVDH